MVDNTLDRRSFLKISLLTSGALLIGVGCEDSAQINEFRDGEWVANLYVRINTDGTVTIVSKYPEVGQGVKTAFPMIVAECMDLDWNSVVVEQAPLDDRYGRQQVGGSYGTPDVWDDLRIAGTAARYILTEAAAKEWAVDSAECHAHQGSIIHKASGRARSYKSLIEVAARQPVPRISKLKLKSRPSEFKLLGTHVSGVDNPEIVTGQVKYGCDTRLDGMLYATFIKCSSFGGKVRKANVEQIRELPGVTHVFVVEGTDNPSGLQSGVAIVAKTWWQTQSARKQLRVEWTTTHSDSSAEFEQAAEAFRHEPGDTLRRDGNVERALDGAEKVVEASYYYPFVAHASMEPQNCTAAYHESGQLELWAPTQNAKSGRALIAKTLRISEDNIHVNLTRIGGGFGRRLRNDYMVEAAWIAREVRVPVQLQWTREDDIQHDFYRPAAWHHFTAGIDNNGRMMAFDHHFVTFGRDGETVSGAGLSKDHYPAGMVPHFRLRQSMIETSIPTGPWRSPGHSAYCWPYQSFFDEVALAAGRDALEFRLDLLSTPGGNFSLDAQRASETLRVAAKEAGWGTRSLGPNHGLGIAFHHDHGGYVAHVAEVVAEGSVVTVKKVYSGIDVGPILNLSGARNQVEGSVVDALSAAQLEITFADGATEQSNFHDYGLLRINQAPDVECHFIQNDIAPTGLGEPPIAPVTPAITNAIFAATGVRIRTLPFRRSGLSV